MGWFFRKSVNFGPLRINISKSGVGYSVGGKDLRVGVDAKGHRYEDVTVPGTGLHYRSSKKEARGKAAGCLGLVLLAVLVTGVSVPLILYCL
jgi:Protein of unknown function (DUF4236)